MNKIKKRLTGFTIVELLVVASILTVLATAIFVSYSGSQAKGRDAARIRDLDDIKSALLLYRETNTSFPPNHYGGSCGITDPTASDCLKELVDQKMISKLPVNPKSVKGVGVTDNWGVYYRYYDYAPDGPAILSTLLEGYHGTAGMNNSFRYPDTNPSAHGGWCNTVDTNFYCIALLNK